MDKNWQEATLAEIVEQLEFCEYECEAGVMTMNLAFEELKRRSKNKITAKDIVDHMNKNASHNEELTKEQKSQTVGGLNGMDMDTYLKGYVDALKETVYFFETRV